LTKARRPLRVKDRVILLYRLLNDFVKRVLVLLVDELRAEVLMRSGPLKHVLSFPFDIIISCRGCSFLVRRGTDHYVLLTDDFEAPVCEFFRPSEGDIVIDVGAYVGFHTIMAARAVGPAGLVVAIEPHPENFMSLMSNVRLNRFSDVICLRCAAWHEDGYIVLRESVWSYGHKALPKAMGKGVLVRARRLDDVADELGLKEVNWVKIGVNGAEPSVIDGMLGILDRNRGKLKLIIEAHSLKEAKACVRRLSELGYVVKLIGANISVHGQVIWLLASARGVRHPDEKLKS